MPTVPTHISFGSPDLPSAESVDRSIGGLARPGARALGLAAGQRLHERRGAAPPSWEKRPAAPGEGWEKSGACGGPIFWRSHFLELQILDVARDLQTKGQLDTQ